MAALLTSMVGIWPAASRSCSTASTGAALPTSSTAPRPLYPCDARLIEKAEAPAALVDVPTTVAPAPPNAIAIALPMPREAPVTRATCFSSMRNSPAGGGLRSGERSIHGRGIFQRHEFEAGPLLDAAIECREHLAGPTLDHLSDTRFRDCAYGGPPLHGPR